MHPVDLVIILFLIGGFVWGFTRGFIYSIFSLLAIVLGAFGASMMAPFIMPAIFPPQYRQAGLIVLFILFFTLIYFIIRKLSYLAEDVIEFLELEWLDSLLGGVIGLFQFSIIIGVLYNILTKTGLSVILPGQEGMLVAPFISGYSQAIVDWLAGNWAMYVKK